MALSSLFSQRLDRVAYLAYFLGSVVPMVALAALARQAGPSLVASVSISWTTVVVSLGLLSLSSFFALRRIARQTQTAMEDDHRRLIILLNASTALSCADNARDAADAAVRHVLRLTSASAAFVFWTGDDGRVVELARSGSIEGDEALLRAVTEAIAQGRPEIRFRGAPTPDGESWTLPATAITPLSAGSRCQGALAMVRPQEAGRFGTADLDALATLAGLAAVAVAAASLRHAGTPEPACV